MADELRDVVQDLAPSPSKNAKLDDRMSVSQKILSLHSAAPGMSRFTNKMGANMRGTTMVRLT